MKSNIYTLLLITTFLAKNTFSQVSVPLNTGIIGNYVGWDIGQGLILNIANEDPLPINFHTDAGAGTLNNLRMFIQGTDGFTGIGNFASANTLLHLHQASDDIGVVNFQMTNGSIGQAANDGFLIDVDQTGIVALRQQERNVPMQFWNMDARLG